MRKLKIKDTSRSYKVMKTRSDDPWTPRRKRWVDMTWRDLVRIGAGVFFGVLGVFGLFLPILQGILFLLIAAFLLAPYSLFVQRQQIRFEKRFPRLYAQAHAILHRLGLRLERHE